MTDVPPASGPPGETPADVPPAGAPNAILDEGADPVDDAADDAADHAADEAVDHAADDGVDHAAIDHAADEPTVPLHAGPGSNGDVLPPGPDAGPDVLPAGPSRRMPINPRMLERLVKVRRAQGHRRLKVVVAVAAIVAAAALALGLTRSPILAVQHVRVTGGTHTSREAVLAVTALGDHPQMIDLSSGRLKREVMTLPWVASARIQRHWPTTVEIRLQERVPVALVAAPRGLAAIVDREGRVLATGPAVAAPSAAPPAALPAVTGVAPAGRAGTFLAPGSGARAALSLVVAMQKALPPASPYQLVAIDRRRDGLLQARLTPHVTVVFGSIDDLDAKLLAVRTLLEQVPLRGIVTLDVRVPTSPALTPR